MPKINLDIVGGSYEMRAVQLDAQRSINCYPTIDQTGKFKSALLVRPGLDLYIDDDNENSVRGILALRGVLYAVIDDKLYICFSNGTRTVVGTLNTSSGLVSIRANDTQLFISDISNGYFYQIIDTERYPAGTFEKIQNVNSTISKPVFFGAGLNDMLSVGVNYLGSKDKIYRVQIDGADTPNTFKWTDDALNPNFAWNAQNIAITASVDQNLNNGVKILFTNDNAHTLGDYWEIKATIDSTFYVPVIPSYQDGYGIYPKQNSNIFYISELEDFSQVNAFDYAQAAVYADNLVAAISVHDELYLIGDTSTEIWYDTGNPDFPFGRKINVVLNYGCEAPFSVLSAANNVIFMLAKNYDGARIIVRIINYNVDIISTEPINEELRTYERVDDAFAFTIERNGHIFYVITFPGADRTWVYDMTVGMWHEWRSLHNLEFPFGSQKVLGRFRGNCHTVFNGQDIIGDSRSGKIFILKEDSNADYDEQIVWERTTQHLSVNNQYTAVNSLQIDIEAGRGSVIPPYDDPQLMLSISKDGGKSWGSEMWRSVGKIGEYKNRAIWYRLGTARNFTFRIRSTDSYYRAVFGAVIDAEVFD